MNPEQREFDDVTDEIEAWVEEQNEQDSSSSLEAEESDDEPETV